ncbi:glycoside hydrolase family 5 protein [Colletotrichum tofieldiae]|nr:glycoside hydrolase family 5 protein [Colletotrichum tofieldiae]
MEDNQVAFTLWNYNPDNRVEYGDGWNMEDFSIVNGNSEAKPGHILPDYTNEAHEEHELYRGGRVLDVIIRPYAVKVAGRPLRSDWNPRTLHYEFEWATETQDASQTEKKQSDKSRTTEVFVPKYHYAERNIDVKVSGGEWSYDPDLQTLYVHHNPNKTNHRLTIDISNVPKHLMETVERRRRAIPPRFPMSLVSPSTELAMEELMMTVLLPGLVLILLAIAQMFV